MHGPEATRCAPTTRVWALLTLTWTLVGCPGRQRVGRCLRVRLDRTGRHGGGRPRRRPPLAGPALPHAAPATVPAHTHTHADADSPTAPAA
ncbi:hypothetical protein [Streptomyces dangxiongensis]|uniref:hypothetical protein n=1 Tax=Streptomyces dangxiongensis TaxID=1442032 RepID=UPI001969C3A7|nr:hypothetical protein [Streptomyces dangxiongensis]